MVKQAKEQRADGERLLLGILEDVLKARADGVELERVSEGLEVMFMLQNTGVGGVLVERPHDDDVIQFIFDNANLTERDRGRFQVGILGRPHTIRVQRFDRFGESAFRLQLSKASKT